MKIRNQVQSALESEARDLFLRTLGHRLGISAREIFASGNPDGLSQARACNEMMIAIWSQLDVAKSAGVAGYPDSEFLAILLSKADIGGARPHLRSALESALTFVDGIIGAG
ncbi:hypothetical protein [Streptomyces sp. G-G2]|uniref:hypothetical protein n=1 Tax=Streptomyces sp. G-G2 TaxID=3046201 RepID=UPI0024BA480B|nr:hypothetical protein [Streptomyces sp. G-G2]MDJ0386177.1 hypothetical protein [Streptomyces sp. G-G2]